MRAAQQAFDASVAADAISTVNTSQCAQLSISRAAMLRKMELRTLLLSLFTPRVDLLIFARRIFAARCRVCADASSVRPDIRCRAAAHV